MHHDPAKGGVRSRDGLHSLNLTPSVTGVVAYLVKAVGTTFWLRISGTGLEPGSTRLYQPPSGLRNSLPVHKKARLSSSFRYSLHPLPVFPNQIPNGFTEAPAGPAFTCILHHEITEPAVDANSQGRLCMP